MECDEEGERCCVQIACAQHGARSSCWFTGVAIAGNELWLNRLCFTVRNSEGGYKRFRRGETNEQVAPDAIQLIIEDTSNDRGTNSVYRIADRERFLSKALRSIKRLNSLLS